MRGRDRWSAPGPTLAEAGESALLAELVRGASSATAALPVPPGDDAAAWRPPPGELVVVTTDTIVEDIDFRRRYQGPWEVGWKAYAVCVSDLAAMGARPGLVVVSVAAPGATAAAVLTDIQLGLLAAAAVDGTLVAGGDLSGTVGPLVVTVTAVGSVDEARCLRRSAARPGDVIVVTGSFGGAAAALGALEAGTEPPAAWGERLRHPQPRLSSGARLGALGVRAAVDCSDGLVLDLGRLAAASGCGADLWLDHVPTAPGLSMTGDARVRELVLGGGEDFELIATAPPAVVERVRAAWPPSEPPLSVVGCIQAETVVRVLAREGGDEVAVVEGRGYQHFQPPPVDAE
ncbi:MAG TPA: thiamine-phosphate kinase [Candidatus Dormibacteraeota bacterium]|nr:thiamine-phosphate kinase [Candidatus Dormibacteraeota bacterium]